MLVTAALESTVKS